MVLLTSDQCCGSKYIEFGSISRILVQFGSGSRSGSGSKVVQSMLKKKRKIILEKNNVLYKHIFFKNKASPKEIFKSVESLNCWFISLNLALFVSILSYFYMFGSGFTNGTKLLNIDLIRIWIRIHNTASDDWSSWPVVPELDVVFEGEKLEYWMDDGDDEGESEQVDVGLQKGLKHGPKFVRTNICLCSQHTASPEKCGLHKFETYCSQKASVLRAFFLFTLKFKTNNSKRFS